MAASSAKAGAALAAKAAPAKRQERKFIINPDYFARTEKPSFTNTARAVGEER